MSDDPLALSPISAAPLAEADYDELCSAVMESERGRWFLTEYARRNRHADTELLLTAIARLEAAVLGDHRPSHSDNWRFDLADMARAIAKTLAEIAAIKPDAERNRKAEAAADNSAMTRADHAIGLLTALKDRIEALLGIVADEGPEPATRFSGEPAIFEECADVAVPVALHAAAPAPELEVHVVDEVLAATDGPVEQQVVLDVEATAGGREPDDALLVEDAVIQSPTAGPVHTRVPVIDPLAALRALSEDEKIALFS